jgi:hypothetical protein
LKKISEKGNEAFISENENSNNEFITIFSENREEILKKLVDILYRYEIYMYDNDGSCIMQEEK